MRLILDLWEHMWCGRGSELPWTASKRKPFPDYKHERQGPSLSPFAHIQLPKEGEDAMRGCHPKAQDQQGSTPQAMFSGQQQSTPTPAHFMEELGPPSKVLAGNACKCGRVRMCTCTCMCALCVNEAVCISVRGCVHQCASVCVGVCMCACARVQVHACVFSKGAGTPRGAAGAGLAPLDRRQGQWCQLSRAHLSSCASN